ncbi:hypothetical protein [Dyadobacter sp. CY323]|uniref:hypothetical protein n=1 Tax=Dyadobacter sp. CY323 TaxID=2907302 RepID=UPI001F2B760B|nr:hypothetical protein [Dyadobacter sp. CY323]MCE6992380.1 hypothetical protein [Dyadobacter sp. CY323]
MKLIKTLFVGYVNRGQQHTGHSDRESGNSNAGVEFRPPHVAGGDFQEGFEHVVVRK